MALSKPAGRLGSDPDAPPGTEKKARSGSGYDGGVMVSFGFGTGSLDEVPVKPSSPVMAGESSMPNTEMGNKSAN